MRGPAISMTTLPVERVLVDERWITSMRTRAASSFSSGEPVMRPSLSIVRQGVMPCVGRGGRGRREGELIIQSSVLHLAKIKVGEIMHTNTSV